MTQTKSGIRRAWVGFSALAFAVCGVLLLVQYSGRLAAPPASAPAMVPGPSAVPRSRPDFVSPPVMPKVPSSAEGASRPATSKVPSSAPGTSRPAHLPAKRDLRAPPKALAAKKGADPAEEDLGGYGAAGTGKLGGHGAAKSSTPPARSPHIPERGGADPTARDDAPPPLAASESPPGKPGTDGAAGAAPGASGSAATSPTTAPGFARTVAVPSGGTADPALTAGVLKVNVPPTMVVGQSEHVRAVVGAKIHVDLVDKEAALETNDGARVQIGRDLMISTLVRMDLRGDNASEFDITSLSPDSVQHINDNDATVWEWSVTPKLEGAHSLTLLVSDLKESTRETLRNKIYPVRIDVHVTAWQRVREVVATGSTLLSGLAGLIGAWLGLLRPLLQRGRPDGGPPSARGLQGPPPPATFNAAHAPTPVIGSTAPPLTSPLPAVAGPPWPAAPPAPAAATSTDALAVDVAVAAAPSIAAVAPSGPVVAAASAVDVAPAALQSSAPSPSGKAS